MNKENYVREEGLVDYIKDGVVHENAPVWSILVESESDLANLEGYYPGSVAYTAGFGHMWMLAADGDWEVVV